MLAAVGKVPRVGYKTIVNSSAKVLAMAWQVFVAVGSCCCIHNQLAAMVEAP